MGGEHKCPLCSATFTRPQHVGRHLRAHTGDRPYECKECPLRFARSDLLSRHVNKAHRPPDENAPAKQTKKGRRKSLGSHADGQPILKPATDKIRAASFSIAPATGPQTALPHPSNTYFHPQSQIPPRQPQAQIPGQAIYPNQPFQTMGGSNVASGSGNMMGTAPALTGWSPVQVAGGDTSLPQFSNPFANPVNGLMPVSGMPYPSQVAHPFTALPMRSSMSVSEQGSSSSSMGRSAQMSGSWSGISQPQPTDFGFKKRACDQCNHSKVRCDFADPCLRCINKNLGCSYNKPPKSRSLVQPMTFPVNQLYRPPPVNYTTPTTITQINTSLSPQSNFSSPYSNITSPLQANIPAYASPVLISEAARRRSSNSNTISPQYLPSAPPLISNSYGQLSTDPNDPLSFIPNSTTTSLPLDTTYAMSVPVDQQTPISYAPIAFDPNLYQPGRPRQGSWNQVLQAQSTGSSMIPVRQMSNGMTFVTETSSSPSLAIAPTPALTSHSTSPSGPSEPQEQRMRSSSGGQGMLNPVYVIPKSMAVDVSAGTPLIEGEQALNLPINNVSPNPATLPADMIAFQPDLTIGPDGLSWPRQQLQSIQPTLPFTSELPVDPMYHFRTNVPYQPYDEDETTASQAGSSSFVDLDENSWQALEHHRRASMGGMWAFNNMTLHDSAGNPISVSPSTAIGLPYSASGGPHLDPVAQQRRPSMIPNPDDLYTDASGRMPSMSDVKDLWKLFMTDMTGPTPSKEKFNALDSISGWTGQGQNQSVLTPRPGMGHRTLSKSNSMPDLTSPIAGQAFFTNYHKPDGSTSHSKVPANPHPNTGHAINGQNGSMVVEEADLPPVDIEALKKWKNEIRQRQDSFSMNMQHPGFDSMGKKNGRSPTNPGLAEEFPFDSTVGSGSDYVDSLQSNNRPMAGVIQGNRALNQTLAPERAPSFGIQGHFDLLPGTGQTSSSFPRSVQYAQQSPLSGQSNIPSQQVPVGMNAYPNNNPTSSVQLGLQQSPPRPLRQSGPSQQQHKQVVKLTSALARPGAKRLASQTLEGTDGKKATFNMFDGQEEEDEDEEQGDDGEQNVQAGDLDINTGIIGISSGSTGSIIPINEKYTNSFNFSDPFGYPGASEIGGSTQPNYVGWQEANA